MQYGQYCRFHFQLTGIPGRLTNSACENRLVCCRSEAHDHCLITQISCFKLTTGHNCMSDPLKCGWFKGGSNIFPHKLSLLIERSVGFRIVAPVLGVTRLLAMLCSRAQRPNGAAERHRTEGEAPELPLGALPRVSGGFPFTCLGGLFFQSSCLGALLLTFFL